MCIRFIERINILQYFSMYALRLCKRYDMYNAKRFGNAQWILTQKTYFIYAMLNFSRRL